MNPESTLVNDTSFNKRSNVQIFVPIFTKTVFSSQHSKFKYIDTSVCHVNY